MKLLTVGDSFTYGEELADLSNAWPNLLAKMINYDLTNLAKPGSGNTRMIRHVVENYQNYDLIIIAWSHHARHEFADANGPYDVWPGCNASAHTHYAPWRKGIIDYISRHHDDDYMFHQQIVNILLLQSFLKHNNKKYLMLDSFDNKEVRIQKKADPLTELIDVNYYVGWPTETMMEWTNGCKKGARGHFLEQGHQVVAEMVYDRIKGLKWGN